MKSWVVRSKNKLRTNYAKAEMWKAEKSRLKYVQPKSAKIISGVALISIMSISYETIENNLKWPFIAAKWSEFSHFFRNFEYLESLNAVLYLLVHNWTEFLLDFNMGESLGLGKKSSGPETDTETWSWFRLPIPKPGFGRTLLQRLWQINGWGKKPSRSNSALFGDSTHTA